MGARRCRDAAQALAAAAACLATVAFVFVPTGRFGDAAYLAAVAGVVAVAWAGAAEARPQDRLPKVALLIAFGVSVSALGDVVERSASLLGATTSSGSTAWLSAIAFFGGYLVLGAVIVELLTPPGDRKRVLRVDALLEAAALIIVGLLTVWTLATIDASGESTTHRAVQVTAPVADLILVAFAGRAILVSRGRSAVSWLLAAGATTWLLTGATIVLVGGESSARVDAGWLLGMLVLALATYARADTVWRDDAGLRGFSAISGSSHAMLGLLLATVPLGVPPLIHLITHPDQRSLYVPYVGMGLLMLITLLRVSRLLSSEAEARAEAARSRRYFRVLADNTVDAILVVDEQHVVTFCSRSAEKYLGTFPQGNLLARVGAIAPHLCGAIDEALEAARGAPGVVVQVELELLPERLAAHPPARWVLARFINLLADPDVRGIVMSLSDSTARKEAELEVERARDAALAGSRAKSTFLATMSHEIRTPLNGVIGLTELMLTTELDDQQSRYAEGVKVAGSALLQVINDILDFSKIEAGRLELDEDDFDVARLLDETAGLVATPAQEKGLDLRVLRSPDVPLGLRGDRVRLRQVLLNLASNAIKFTASGEVVLTVRLEAPLTSSVASVRFEVVDTGIGVDPEQRDQLFDAFTQADSSTTRRFGGTGLGLAICRQLVTAMGGEIGVVSRAGGGSTFWLSVPLPVSTIQPGPAVPPVPRAAPPDPAPSPGVRGRVLVVEDSEVNQLVAVGILEHLGYEATVAQDGLEAVSMLRSTPFDVVLMDCLMPGMDGYQATAEIRRLGLTALPVIAMTASAVAGDRERCLAAGMNDYLTKPATAVAVAAVLERWLPASRPAPTQGG